MMYILDNILLENGMIFNCVILNKKNVFAELIFNTSNYGYIESISDPSYKSQILILSSPHIGNIGWVYQDCQSYKIFLNGIIINNYSICNNFRKNLSLFNFLKKKKIPVIINTNIRYFISLIRNAGSQICFSKKKNFNFFTILKYIRFLMLKKIFYD